MSGERRPLLRPAHSSCDNSRLSLRISSHSVRRRDEDGRKATPLPMKQISILLLMQLSEPLSYSVIYPFVAQLVKETRITGGDDRKIGYYTGMIESIFFLTESVFTIHYGRISDRIGRRPVLMFGLFGQAISIFSVGLSKKFWQLVVSRSLSGALNGNVGVSKSMVAELTDETNQAQAFAFLPIVWSVGSTLGPFLGGTLSRPAELLPSVFDTPFWNKYPYFLPCLVTAIYAAVVFLVGAFSLKETHVTRSQDNKIEHGTPSAHSPPERPSIPIRSVLTKRARIAISNYGILAFSDITYLSLQPVMFAVPVENGGLGLSPRVIGLILGLQGICTGLVQALFFARLHDRFGNKRVYVTGYLCYLFLVLSLPIMHALAVREMWTAVWVVFGFVLALSCPAFMTFSCMSIYVNSSAPSRDALGTLNGISQTMISVMRAIGPAAATSLFALSVEKNIFGGNLVYAILLGVIFLGVYSSRWLKGEKRAY